MVMLGNLNLSTDNVSLYTIPVAYLLAFIPHVYLEFQVFGKAGSWNNVYPRGNIERIATTITKADQARLKRAVAAHTNGLEMFPLFASAVLASNHAGLSTETINKWSLIYLLLRFLYNPAYIAGTGVRLSSIRSLIWFASGYSSLRLLFLAANKQLGK